MRVIQRFSQICPEHLYAKRYVYRLVREPFSQGLQEYMQVFKRHGEAHYQDIGAPPTVRAIP